MIQKQNVYNNKMKHIVNARARDRPKPQRNTEPTKKNILWANLQNASSWFDAFYTPTYGRELRK